MRTTEPGARRPLENPKQQVLRLLRCSSPGEAGHLFAESPDGYEASSCEDNLYCQRVKPCPAGKQLNSTEEKRWRRICMRWHEPCNRKLWNRGSIEPQG